MVHAPERWPSALSVRCARARSISHVEPCPPTQQAEVRRFAALVTTAAREGTRPNAEELINLVKARKGSAHAPKQIKFVTELPMTGVGKVDKKLLKAGFWAGRDRMVG